MNKKNTVCLRNILYIYIIFMTKILCVYVQSGCRVPMAWPFLSAVAGGGNAAATAVSPALHAQAAAQQLPTAAQQILLAPRAMPRRRYSFQLHTNQIYVIVMHPNQLISIDTSTSCTIEKTKQKTKKLKTHNQKLLMHGFASEIF